MKNIIGEIFDSNNNGKFIVKGKTEIIPQPLNAQNNNDPIDHDKERYTI